MSTHLSSTDHTAPGCRPGLATRQGTACAPGGKITRFERPTPRGPADEIQNADWFDELRPGGVRAGDTLQLRQEWLDKRVSDSKPDRGVARSRISLVNEDGVEVTSHIDTILGRRRNPTN